MKALAVLAACVALCASSAIPEIPGDNSHYVEGESRYIWMPDGEGVPRLVDLEAEDFGLDVSRRGANNEYLLFTRNNPDVPQVLVDGNIDSILNSNFVKGNPIKVIAHGFQNNRNSEVCTTVTKAFLSAGDYNVIVLEWRSGQVNYPTASNGVVSVGKYLGNFLVWLVEETGASWDDVHLVGFSLGAHVVGNAGRTTGGRVARITGLDPAGPRFGNNRNALNKNDAVYVEAIHTDGGRLGIFDSIADADFYPNGGRNPQPGCWVSTCSHGRAYELFASTVRFNHLEGKQCPSTSEAQKVKCNGPSLLMGNTDLSKRGSGIYALLTSKKYPFEL